jgi:hypothetical protein
MIAAAVSDDAEQRARARELVELLTADDGSFTKGSDEFYVNIACEEVFTDLRANDFSGGEFVQSGVNYCAEAGLYGSRRFDAAKYPVKAPIYYLQGADDPATPAALARLHFDGQTASPNRQYLLVNGGGHNPFKMNMSDCYQTVFAAMANQGDFAASLATCGWSEGFALTSIKDGAATTANLDGAALTLTAVDQLFDNAPVTEQLIQPLRGLLISK